MRKIPVFIILFLGSFLLDAKATLIDPPLNANDIFIGIGKNGEKISLQAFSHIRVNDFESFTGHRMKFMERISFRITQKKLRNAINEGGMINDKGLLRLLKVDREALNIALTGFAMGLLLNVFGVFFAYLFKDKYRKKRIKWAWIGLAALAVFVLIFALSFDYGRVE